MVQLSCPDVARWRALLADSASAATDLESHLATCARCRELLDDLAVGSSGWLRDAGRLAADTDRDPEMTRTLHRLRDAMPDDHPDPPIALDFLTRSDQPGILGTLGRYQVLEVIGRGAFGIVLKAIDPDLLRPVAVKVLAPYLAPSGTARERFKREARAAAAVSHDHVVTIHAVEEANGLPFFVMEYVTGVSLQGRLDRDGPLPPRDIARIGMQAANGLAAAHEQGLVHRDVKPANILLENGVERVKLTDFGLARAADDARLTQSGVAAGTPLYMSPEQARGEAVDARSDLFSLGTVLYTLATGFPPFRAGTAMGVLHRIINDPPRPIRETIPDFPADLEAIIMQLLEKDPAKRFQLGADVSIRLGAFLSRPPREPAAPADGEAGDGPATEKTSPWVVALCLLAAAAMVAVVLTFRTPHGTLVVEVNDPAVKVALDGNELTITGAGTQEVRLKPGAYHVTAAAPPGKTATVSPEVVTIKKDDKVIVTVRVEPAADLPPTVAGPVEPKRDSAPARGQPPVAPGGPRTQMDPEWEAKLDPLRKQFDDLVRRLAGTPAGPLVLLPGPVADPDKFVAGVKEADRDKVKRLLALRDQFALMIPRAQASAVQLHRLKDLVANSARTNVRRELEAMHAALAGQLREMELIAADLGAKPYRPDMAPDTPRPEGEFQKVMAEYDALVLRLARHRVGRVVVIIPQPWNEGTLAERGYDQPKILNATKLLNVRDEVQAQAEKARAALQALDNWRARGAEIEAGATPAVKSDYEARIRDGERDLKVGTETIRGLVDDLKKLADELDPPAKAAPGDPKLNSRFQKVQELKEKIERIERARVEIRQVREFLQAAENEFKDLEAKRKAETDPKAAEDLDLQLARARRHIGDCRDRMTAARAELARVGPAEPLQKELDQLRKEIDESLPPASGGEADPPAKKADEAPNEDPRFQQVRELKDRIARIEAGHARVAELADLLGQAEKKVKDLEVLRKGTTDAKKAAELDRQLTDARRSVEDIKDGQAEESATPAKLPAVEPLRKELDRLRKEIAESLGGKGPPPGKGAKD